MVLLGAFPPSIVDYFFPYPFMPSLNRATAILLLSVFLAAGCRQREKAEEFKPNTGQIQVLNACGLPGAAEATRNFLTDKGFDVVEFGNADYWNFSETIVVARTEKMEVARDLARVLKTDNLIQLIDSSQMVDATVFIGRDYFRRIE